MAARETTNPTFDKKHIIPERYLHLSDGEMIRKIYGKKRQFGNDLLILAHHYQKNEIIPFADYVGDSLQLAKEAAANQSDKHIIFCGVHFMAETADMLTTADQKVLLARCFSRLFNGRYG